MAERFSSIRIKGEELYSKVAQKKNKRKESDKGVSVKRGVGVYLFLKECCFRVKVNPNWP